jgi:hypothetical protein
MVSINKLKNMAVDENLNPEIPTEEEEVQEEQPLEELDVDELVQAQTTSTTPTTPEPPKEEEEQEKVIEPEAKLPSSEEADYVRIMRNKHFQKGLKRYLEENRYLFQGKTPEQGQSMVTELTGMYKKIASYETEFDSDDVYLAMRKAGFAVFGDMMLKQTQFANSQSQQVQQQQQNIQNASYAGSYSPSNTSGKSLMPAEGLSDLVNQTLIARGQDPKSYKENIDKLLESGSINSKYHYSLSEERVG